jgi:putative flippase GtrA
MRSLLRRGLRFGTVGVACTVVGLALIWVAWRWWAWDDVAANALGYAAGFLMSFVFNREWTFRDQAPPAAGLARFTLVCALAYALNLAVLAAVRSAIGPDSFWPQLLAVGAYSVAAFLGSHFYAFRLQRSAEPQP